MVVERKLIVTHIENNFRFTNDSYWLNRLMVYLSTPFLLAMATGSQLGLKWYFFLNENSGNPAAYLKVPFPTVSKQRYRFFFFGISLGVT